MNRVLILIVVVVVAVASGVFLFKLIGGEEDGVDLTKAVPTQSSEKQNTPRPTRKVRYTPRRQRNTPIVVDVAEETPMPTPTPTIDESDPFQLLYAKTNQWVYRGYMQIGDDKYGMMENFRTGDGWQVQEGENYNDVLIDNLSSLACIVRLDTATRELLYSPELDLDVNEIFNGPPSQEAIATRVADYDRHVRPTFEYMASKYTPGPHETMPMPLSKEEVQKNVDYYMTNIAPTFAERAKHYTPHPGEIMPKKPDNPQDEKKAQMSYIGTYHPEHLATAFPDWKRYFEQQEEYERQMAERQKNQGSPQPSPNQNPY